MGATFLITIDLDRAQGHLRIAPQFLNEALTTGFVFDQHQLGVPLCVERHRLPLELGILDPPAPQVKHVVTRISFCPYGTYRIVGFLSFLESGVPRKDHAYRFWTFPEAPEPGPLEHTLPRRDCPIAIEQLRARDRIEFPQCGSIFILVQIWII